MAELWFTKSSHVAITNVSDEFLLLDHATGSCHVVNETAGWLISLAAKPLSLRTAAVRAAQRYVVPASDLLERDLEEIVRVMQAHGLVEIGSGVQPEEEQGTAAPARNAKPWVTPSVLRSYTEEQLDRELSDVGHQVHGQTGPTAIAGIRG